MKQLIKELPVKELAPGYQARLLHTANQTFSFVTVTAGALLAAHAHPHEQVSQVLSGSFELVLEGKPQLLQPGDILVIPSNAIHSGRAVTDCELLDVFYPVREEYRV